MTIQELEAKAKELGFSFVRHQALSGSKYFTIDNVKFRLADHYQPSHYQIRDYFDINSINSIATIISNELFSFRFNPNIENGKYYDMQYNFMTDKFKAVELTEVEFYKNLKKLAAQKEFYLEYGWDGMDTKWMALDDYKIEQL